MWKGPHPLDFGEGPSAVERFRYVGMNAAVRCLQLRSTCTAAKTSRPDRRQQLVVRVGIYESAQRRLRAATPRSVRPGRSQFFDSFVSGLLALDALDALDAPRQLDPSQGTSHPARSHKSMAAANRLWWVAAA